MRTLALAAILFVACASVSLAAEENTPKDSYEALRTTGIFAFGGVGVAGTRVPAELAFDEVIKKGDAAAVFRRLLASATPEGQLYALVDSTGLTARRSTTWHRRTCAARRKSNWRKAASL